MAEHPGEKRRRVSASRKTAGRHTITDDAFTAGEQEALCAVAARLCPELNEDAIGQAVRKYDAMRRAQISRLRRAVRGGEYRVPASFVAAAILLEGHSHPT